MPTCYVCVCVYIYICVCVNIVHVYHVCVCACAYACPHMLYIYIYTRIYTYVYARMYCFLVHMYSLLIFCMFKFRFPDRRTLTYMYAYLPKLHISFHYITVQCRRVHHITFHCNTQYITGGWPTPLKNDGVRQLGWSFPIYGKIKVMFQTINQLVDFPIKTSIYSWFTFKKMVIFQFVFC